MYNTVLFTMDIYGAGWESLKEDVENRCLMGSGGYGRSRVRTQLFIQNENTTVALGTKLKWHR